MNVPEKINAFQRQQRTTKGAESEELEEAEPRGMSLDDGEVQCASVRDSMEETRNRAEFFIVMDMKR